MVRDPLDWAWFPELGVMTMDGDRRHVTLPSGLPIVEQIVNVDDSLRRFQYVIVDNFVISDHLSTIDVIDLESTNGTFVNGQRIERARVRSGDLLQVGRLALKVERVAES